MPRSRTALRTLASLFSNANSGVWTPITTSPCVAYLSDHARTYGIARRQLMHEYVQKSTSTTLPRSPFDVSGGEFTHATAPSSDGIVPSTGSVPRSRTGVAFAFTVG